MDSAGLKKEGVSQLVSPLRGCSPLRWSMARPCRPLAILLAPLTIVAVSHR
jgi:hypothetical protein